MAVGIRVKLPGLSQLMVDFSHLLDDQWYIVIAFVVLTIGGFIYWRRSARGRRQWDRIKLRIPAKIGNASFVVIVRSSSSTCGNSE